MSDKNISKKKTSAKKNSGFSLEEATSTIKGLSLENESPIKALEQSGITSPLIIIAKEELRAKRFLKWFTKKTFLSPEKEATTENLTFFADDLNKIKNQSSFLNCLDNLSLFSEQKLLVVYQADKIKSASAKAFIERLKKPHNDSFVILLGSSINRQTPLLNNLKTSSTVIEIDSLTPNKLRIWFQKEARLHGAERGIENSVCQKLIESYSGNLFLASNEIQKLALLAEDGLISETTAQKLKFKTPERQSFEIIDHLARKDLKLCLLRAEELLRQGQHPLQISSMLGRSFRIMLAISKNQGKTSGLSSDFANPWFAKNLSKSAVRFKTSSLERNLSHLRKLDESLKLSKLNPENVLKNTLSKIIAE